MTDRLSGIHQVLRGRYEIERELAHGGMAVVYLARDLRHERLVAIKVLKPELAAIVGGERFLDEIRTVANLQHPHILPLHDSGAMDGTVYYVMPYVAGESLRARLAREKQLPVGDALRITREVASALDYAHRHGVIHRDIKPENILLHDGSALVADFGIALAMSRSEAATRLTETGMSVGTPQYMSPEQAMGEREISPRSDIYSLACVAYEMLAGEPPFAGPTAQAIIARVLTEDARPLSALRRSVPAHVEGAVHTALARLPADRFGTAAQFASALADASTLMAPVTRADGGRTSRARAFRGALFGLAALALIAAGALLGRFLGRAPGRAPPAVMNIRLPDASRLTASWFGVVAVSRDGSVIAFTGATPEGVQLFTRRMDDGTVTPVAGTEGGFSPVFSPDSRWLGFTVGTTQRRRVPLPGGSSVPLDVPPSLLSHVLWVGPDEFLYPSTDGTLMRFRNGAAEVVALPALAPGATALVPVDVLPDGRVLVVANSQGATGALWAVHPRTGEGQLVLAQPVGAAAYHDGHLAWVLPSGELVAASWNRNGAAVGTPHVLARDVRISPGAAPHIAFAPNGTIVYGPARPPELVRADRSGRMTVIGGAARALHGPRVSPDGRFIAMDITTESRDVWLFDVEDATYTRVTFQGDSYDPMWLPDGRHLLYATSRSGTVGIARVRIDGTGTESLLHTEGQISAHTVTPDGRTAVAARLTEYGNFDLMTLSLSGQALQRPLIDTRHDESYPALSPDGRWLAYKSDDSGRDEVYVRPFGRPGGRTAISQNGGTEPVWSPDGREVFYRDLDGAWLLAATVATEPAFRVLARTPLFEIRDIEPAGPHANYDVTPDGHFIFVRTPPAAELVVIQNWSELVRRRAQ